MREIRIRSGDGTALAARRSGSGSPLVLVHGANGDRDTFALVEPLLARRHAVWVYSRRGRGDSGDGRDYSFQREVEDVLAVLAAAGERAHLFGHSAGALYALVAARHATSLRSLVLYEPPLRSEALDPVVLAAVERAVMDGDLDRALELFFPAAGATEAELSLLRSYAGVWARAREGIRLLPREITAWRREGRAAIAACLPPDVPTLYLYGDRTDNPVFPTVDNVARLFPRVKVQALPGQRHLAFAFDPPAFAQAVLDFTTAHDSGPRSVPHTPVELAWAGGNQPGG